ncbi:hypothetical protein V2A60_008208 [Cordyceps javanica]
MATTATDIVRNGDVDLVRPRPRNKAALHSLLKQESATDSTLSIPDSTTSAATSGRSTPVPENAPPSNKAISSARKTLRAEQREQQQQQQRRRRIFPTTDFASRLSHFDPDSDHRDFHGFFNLFWIGLAIMGITTMLRHMKDTGYPFSFAIWSLFTVKLWHLAVADFLMVATTAVALPLHRLFRAAPRDAAWTWRRGGVAVQSLYQAAWLAVWVAVPFWLEWTWTSQVFLLLHTMVLLMKMHSYAFYNGHLSETEKRLCRLDEPTSRGTKDRSPPYIYPVAAANRRSSKAGIVVDLDGGREDIHLHHAKPEEKQLQPQKQQQPATTSPITRSKSKSAPPKPYVSGDNDDTTTKPDHECDSDDEIELLRDALARELTSPMGHVTYPHNLTWANYFDFLLCPTLCYELEYPRTATINWTSLISKIVAVFGCIFLLTITSEDFILPVLVDAEARLVAIRATAAAAAAAGGGTQSPSQYQFLAETGLVLAETISWLLFPFMLTFLLVFLVIFEYVLGAMAEITRFADRRFYADWWNSTDWMEFSREWNVPVHAFLRRHVYSASRPFTGRAGATALTFLISAVGHEIVMACITKKLRGYGFVCQMLQLPIVMLQRTKWVRGRRTLNNVCFWSSMIMGLSLICALYVLL